MMHGQVRLHVGVLHGRWAARSRPGRQWLGSSILGRPSTETTYPARGCSDCSKTRPRCPVGPLLFSMDKTFGSDSGFASRTNTFGQLSELRRWHENESTLLGTHSQALDRGENPVAVTHLGRLNRRRIMMRKASNGGRIVGKLARLLLMF